MAVQDTLAVESLQRDLAVLQREKAVMAMELDRLGAIEQLRHAEKLKGTIQDGPGEEEDAPDVPAAVPEGMLDGEGHLNPDWRRPTASELVEESIEESIEALPRQRIEKLFEGSLSKIGMINTMSRWGVLNEESFSIFLDPKAAIAKTFIPYHRIKTIVKEGSNRFVIKLQFGKTDHTFEAESNARRELWVTTLLEFLETWKAQNVDHLDIRNMSPITPRCC